MTMFLLFLSTSHQQDCLRNAPPEHQFTSNTETQASNAYGIDPVAYEPPVPMVAMAGIAYLVAPAKPTAAAG